MGAKSLICGLAALALSGCASISQYEAECRKTAEDFSTFASCTSDKIRNTSDLAAYPTKDLSNLYAAYLDALAERSQREDISDAEAYLAASTMFSRLKGLAQQRQYSYQASVANTAAAYGMMMQGLGIYQASQRPVYPPAPNRPITCTQMGSFFTCQ